MRLGSDEVGWSYSLQNYTGQVKGFGLYWKCNWKPLNIFSGCSVWADEMEGIYSLVCI